MNSNIPSYKVAQMRPRNCGAALIIVLAFMSMLLVLLLAFFSKSTLQQQVSKSSESGVSVDVFARGAVANIIGDLQQEIIAGSLPVTITSGSVSTTLYYPTTNLNAVPQLSGFKNAAGLENLIKVSGASPFFTLTNGALSITNVGVNPTNLSSLAGITNGAIRGTTNSTTNASYNGRAISAARWNAPLLLPLSNSVSTSDYTPTTNFTPPNWILVARNGSNPTNFSTSTGSDMRWNLTNPTTVIGRYAYTIYNEGGLLDANVAGYPNSLSTTNYPQLGYKSGTFFADLAQIGLLPVFRDALVGWRNTNSAQVSGTYPGYIIYSTGATNYASNALANTNFLIAYTNSSGSDRAFTSRQQLISFLLNVNTNAQYVTNALNALQYLGTFSRSLNQPTSWPDPNRPKEYAANYQNVLNTNALGNSGSGKEDAFNPPFPTIRVTNSFSRNDGTIAQVGDPLVKRRFPLNRLSWITADGPSATMVGSDATLKSAYTTLGVSTSLLSQGTTNNITKYFGLKWNPSAATYGRGGYWTYNHGLASGIATLAQVASLNREPDFFELLKASINCAAIAQPVGGKGNDDTASNVYPLIQGASVDNAIIQIGANIINQANPDNYPRWIVFKDSVTSRNYSSWGIVDLPYYYGSINSLLMTRDANTSGGMLNNQGAVGFTNNEVDWKTNSGNAAPTAITKPKFQGYITNDPGSIALVSIPIIWNPHAPGTNSSVSPSNLRLWVSSYSVTNLTSSLTVTNIHTAISGTNTNTAAHYWSNAPNIYPPLSSISTNSNSIPIPWNLGIYNSTNETLTIANNTPSNTILTFNNSSTLYREPTPLARQNIPSGSSLALDSHNLIVTSSPFNSGTNGGFSGVKYGQAGIPQTNATYNVLGILAAQWPVRWAEWGAVKWVTNIAGIPHTNTTIVTTNHIFTDFALPIDTNTVSLEYDAGGGNWVPYQQQMATLLQGNNYYWTAYSNSALTNNVWKSAGLGGNYFKHSDPRCKLWYGDQGISVTFGGGSNSWAFVDQNSTNPGTFCLTGINSPNTFPVSYSTKIGAYAKNLFLEGIDGTSDGGPNSVKRGIRLTNGYLVCPDGIVRRPMGAWMSASSSNTFSNTIGSPTAQVWSSFTPGTGFTATNAADINNLNSRPIILHRPFRNVGELGYVMADGAPWRNLDCMTPESCFTELFDTFCINDAGDANGIVAGKVDLNTRQTNVLSAILFGAYRDELNSNTPILVSELTNITTALVARTTNTTTPGKGPIFNISQLVGRYVPGLPTNSYYCYGNIAPSFDGFSADLGNSVYTGAPVYSIVSRFREAAMRALLDCGQAGTWNLMIDVIAQTGKFPSSASSLSQFQVEGEKRFWVHLAIDRLTGKVIDEQIEPVSE